MCFSAGGASVGFRPFVAQTASGCAELRRPLSVLSDRLLHSLRKQSVDGWIKKTVSQSSGDRVGQSLCNDCHCQEGEADVPHC